ncbi:hypothetical protein AXG93_4012s1360 [Marchantia polymorpha subsp. ruderalis]|uniref:Uncharacterized protein n=1 Tax=Marchantia polymorpha subsp. ruderalis TaxID=1480154 RepID=A0A176VMM6_MARPO|nr:hypothetical protein AXG93_4012s1360 [Marchantia polymorpha subsp. ruderalis]
MGAGMHRYGGGKEHRSAANADPPRTARGRRGGRGGRGGIGNCGGDLVVLAGRPVAVIGPRPPHPPRLPRSIARSITADCIRRNVALEFLLFGFLCRSTSEPGDRSSEFLARSTVDLHVSAASLPLPLCTSNSQSSFCGEEYGEDENIVETLEFFVAASGILLDFSSIESWTSQPSPMKVAVFLKILRAENFGICQASEDVEPSVVDREDAVAAVIPQCVAHRSYAHRTSRLSIAPCASYLLRKRALRNDMNHGKCGERKAPEFCLCAEGFMVVLQQLACICSIIACLVGNDELSAASNALNCAADLVFCTVCGCMQTQHKVEMDKRDGMFGDVTMQPPAQVVMSRFDQPTPPAVGYPPHYPNQYPNQAPYPNVPPGYPNQAPYPGQAPGYPVYGAPPPPAYGQQYPHYG